ncbi:elongation of very long chain fatty acids protein 7-like isoform X3 [Oryzias latipes]|uniref:elongation of very long chain fatty acids protein 7-like isoform X3 n=1 Tax=Oryzias latipes TaxID=8090 RepID=UPI0005CBF2F2|nr:elongation of very long chain fatty acids protein 7-like isoform X3 [Oryzias latipes]
MTGKHAVTIWQRIQLFYQSVLENGDKRTDEWLLVYSPMPISCVFLCYLIIIWVGPKLMVNRQPVNLRTVLIVYNFAMVCLSAYMFYEFTASSWLAGYSLLCQPVDYSESPLAMRMARVCWWFYFSKVIELSDTIFFILRKKNSQLTFLHVYHHATMIFNWWAGVNVPDWFDQLLRPCSHVLVLRAGSCGSQHDQISVVETVPHISAAAAVLHSLHPHHLQPVGRL